MIQPASIPYEMTVYDVRSQNLHPDGTPKAKVGYEFHLKLLFLFLYLDKEGCSVFRE